MWVGVQWVLDITGNKNGKGEQDLGGNHSAIALSWLPEIKSAMVAEHRMEPLMSRETITACVFAGVPAVNRSLYHRIRFLVGDPAALI